ncbi:MAG: DMT family transporter [Chloroflexi bacterium]|nr:DMT family transporter [Chloroflexota bacterium]
MSSASSSAVQRARLGMRRRFSAVPSGYLYVMVAILGGSVASIVTKQALTEAIPAIPMLATRLIVSAALLWLIQFFIFRERPKLERRLLLGAAAAGLTNAVSLTSFYLALLHIDASIAMVLFSAHPLIVLGMLLLLGSRPTRLDAGRAGLGLIGVTLLVGIGGQVAWQGVALTLVTVVFFSIHLIIVQRYLYGYSSTQITPLFISVMAICDTLVYFFTSPPAEWFVFSANGWVVIGITAVFSTVIARLALTAGIQRLGSAQTALLSPIETVLAVGMAAVFLGERLSPLQLIGGTLVLVSAMLVVARKTAPAQAIERSAER